EVSRLRSRPRDRIVRQHGANQGQKDFQIHAPESGGPPTSLSSKPNAVVGPSVKIAPSSALRARTHPGRNPGTGLTGRRSTGAGQPGHVSETANRARVSSRATAANVPIKTTAPPPSTPSEAPLLSSRTTPVALGTRPEPAAPLVP